MKKKVNKSLELFLIISAFFICEYWSAFLEIILKSSDNRKHTSPQSETTKAFCDSWIRCLSICALEQLFLSFIVWLAPLVLARISIVNLSYQANYTHCWKWNFDQPNHSNKTNITQLRLGHTELTEILSDKFGLRRNIQKCPHWNDRFLNGLPSHLFLILETESISVS